jgi:2'-5' RNA ligase
MFVSLDPPPGARTEAAKWGRLAARANRGLRPVQPEAIHLTLAFLGTMPIGETGVVADAIERSARIVEGIQSGAPIWLPKRRPRALALELREGSGSLDVLRARLVEELGRQTGWKPERSGFLPHLTVARAGREFRPAGGNLEPAPVLRFDPASITLYRSHLEPTGARYEAIYSLALDPQPG